MSAEVLMYHDVIHEKYTESGFDTPGANYYKTEVEAFESHLSLLSQMIHDGRIRYEDVVFTFDDGGVSSYSVIAPLLEKYNFVGHFYISTDYIGEPTFLSEQEIKLLVQRGHKVGSHSASHPSNMSILSKEDRQNEWAKSISRLKEITGAPIEEISVPNGFLIKEDIDFVKALGISKIYTSKFGENRQDAGVTFIGRYPINRDTTAKEIQRLFTSRYYRMSVRSRQRILSLIKSVLGNNYIKIKKHIRKWL